MDNLELLDLFQAEEEALQRALSEHGLIANDPDNTWRESTSDLLRCAFELPDHDLIEKLKGYVATDTSTNTEFQRDSARALHCCFWMGKLGSLRLLLRAGVKATWTSDQVSLALGEVPTSPQTGDADPFCFACRVGNLEAAQAYRSQSDAGRGRKSVAIVEAVNARATEVVSWLLAEGFDPNAVDDNNWGALEQAAKNEDLATAEVLLAAGADPLGSSTNYLMTPVARATSAQMRNLFVRFGVNPGRFEYQVNPETVRLSFLPEKALTKEEFDLNRSRRAGRSNPERFLPDFWHKQIRTGRYSAPKEIDQKEDRTKPVWSFVRYGRSATPLPDGRLVFIGGEHEDHYDPDFCIYADVTVLDGKGGVEHFIYPEEIFPPTDFHSATLHMDQIWLIGSLGYPDGRQEGITQVLRLDLADFSFHPVETTNDAPGWIHKHRAALVGDMIVVTGGKVEPGYRDNEDAYLLDLKSLSWSVDR